MSSYGFSETPHHSGSFNRHGLRPSIYASPRTPSTASTATQIGDRTSSIGSRKRARPGSPIPSSTPAQSTRYSNQSWVDSHADSLCYSTASPPPLANSKYRLAGGLDTPTAAVNARLDSLDCASADSDFRRRWARTTSAEGRPTYTLQGLQRERNGRSRMSSMGTQQGSNQESWSVYVFRVAGGLAGKAWGFFGPTFSGFTAGGGTGYAMSAGSAPSQIEHEHDQDQAYLHAEPRRERDTTPVPGGYPNDDDFEQLSYHPSDSERDQQPPSKRLQTSQGSAWVVVNHVPSAATAPASANRLASTSSPYAQSPSSTHHRTSTSTTTSRVPRPTTHRTGDRSVSLRKPQPRSTSAASLRSPTSPHAHPHHSPATNTQNQRPASRASYASPRSPSNAARPSSPSLHRRAEMRSDTTHNRISPEASPTANPARPLLSTPTTGPASTQSDSARLALRQARQERAADASVRRLNRRLQDMIAQGREALASRVEVDDDDVDGMEFDAEDGDGGYGGYGGYDGGVMDDNMVDEGFSEDLGGGYGGGASVVDLHAGGGGLGRGKWW